MRNSICLVLGLFSLVSAPMAFGASSKPAQETCDRLLNPTSPSRFREPIRALESFLPHDLSEPLEPLIARMVKEDARKHLFFLESLGRLYKEVYGEPFNTVRDELKSFEDALGAYIENKETLEFAVKFKAPQKIIEVLEQKEQTGQNTLSAFIRENSWTRARAANLYHTLVQYPFKPQAKENPKLVKAMIEELKEYENLEFDMTDLEGEAGIHKLRRRARWFLIELQALQGLVRLAEASGPQTLNEYHYLNQHPIAESPFSKINEHPEIENPVLLQRHLFLAVSKIVQELGTVKTYGELIECMAAAYLESGLAKNNKQAFARARAVAERDPKFVETYSGARQLLKELKRTGLIRKIRKELEKASRL